MTVIKWGEGARGPYGQLMKCSACLLTTTEGPSLGGSPQAPVTTLTSLSRQEDLAERSPGMDGAKAGINSRGAHLFNPRERMLCVFNLL